MLFNVNCNLTECEVVGWLKDKFILEVVYCDYQESNWAGKKGTA